MVINPRLRRVSLQWQSAKICLLGLTLRAMWCTHGFALEAGWRFHRVLNIQGTSRARTRCAAASQDCSRMDQDELCSETSRCGTCGEHMQPHWLGRRIPPLFVRDKQAFHAIVGHVPAEVQEKVASLVQKGSNYWPETSRGAHKGGLYGLGLKVGFTKYQGQPFAGTEELKDHVDDILSGLLNTSMVKLFLSNNNGRKRTLYPNYSVPPLPSAQPGIGVKDSHGNVLNAYVGRDYMHVDVPVKMDHAPPVPVAKILGVPSCKQTCSVCKHQGCEKCSQCCVHTDNDHSLSVLLGIQEPDTDIDNMGFFVMGNKAFSLAGGRVFLFDGRYVPHGVWCMHGSYTGMAFVQKRSLKHAGNIEKWNCPICGLLNSAPRFCKRCGARNPDPSGD